MINLKFREKKEYLENLNQENEENNLDFNEKQNNKKEDSLQKYNNDEEEGENENEELNNDNDNNFILENKKMKNNDKKDDSSYNNDEGEENDNEEQNINKEENNMDNNQNIEIGKSKENEEDVGENGEEEYKIEGEEEGGENYEQEIGEEEHLGDEEIQNDLNSDEQNEIHYNIEEYLPYEHKHDQYSCSCCEHYYNETIKNNTNLPEAKCEVCGNEINQRSLNFYKNKNRNSKTKK